MPYLEQLVSLLGDSASSHKRAISHLPGVQTGERKWTKILKELNVPAQTQISTHSLRALFNSDICRKFFRSADNSELSQSPAMLGQLVEKYGNGLIKGVNTEIRAQTEMSAYLSGNPNRQGFTNVALSHTPNVAQRHYIQPRMTPQMLRERFGSLLSASFHFMLTIPFDYPLFS